MTIAGFYLSPEGIVFGADSTMSLPAESGLHYFDFNQKVFEVGESGTLGMLTWGLGNLWPKSYRTLIALLGDALEAAPATSITDVANRWIDLFWNEFQQYTHYKRLEILKAMPPHIKDADPPIAGARSSDEENEYASLASGLVAGFCIGGYVLSDRKPQAVSILFDPLLDKPTPTLFETECSRWWGVPNIVNRLMYGADDNLVNAILDSGKWNGTQQDLIGVVHSQSLNHGSLPIRDAIDYVHSCVLCTIKAMKFSNMSQICGGPIELAVITSDRKFRWVRHKPWDAAITDGGL